MSVRIKVASKKKSVISFEGFPTLAFSAYSFFVVVVLFSLKIAVCISAAFCIQALAECDFAF